MINAKLNDENIIVKKEKFLLIYCHLSLTPLSVGSRRRRQHHVPAERVHRGGRRAGGGQRVLRHRRGPRGPARAAHPVRGPHGGVPRLARALLPPARRPGHQCEYTDKLNKQQQNNNKRVDSNVPPRLPLLYPTRRSGLVLAPGAPVKSRVGNAGAAHAPVSCGAAYPAFLRRSGEAGRDARLALTSPLCRFAGV